MKSNKWSLLVVFAMLLVAVLGCKTTPQITELKLCKTFDEITNKCTEDVSGDIGPGNTFYAVANLKGIDTHKITFSVLYDDVKGHTSGELVAPTLRHEMQLNKQIGVAYLKIPVGTSGAANGKYKIEAKLADDKGVQTDIKTIPFNVAGFDEK